MGGYFSLHFLLCLLWTEVFIAQSQNECTLPSVQLRYGLLLPSELNPATGSSVTLTCESGSETDFVWQKNGEEIFNVDSNFVIPLVAASDGGVYQCGVRVMECNETAVSNQIPINTEPSISLLVGQDSVMEGAVLSLFCVAQGWPTPSISWLFNGSPVSSSQTYTIPSITPAQEGLYQCRASNSRGMDSRNHSVSVIALPTTTGTINPTSELVSTPTTGPNNGSTAPTSTASTDNDNANMGEVTTSAAPFLPAILEAPLIIILVVTVILAVGVLLIFFIMGCLCCTELRRAKMRRGSDEVALLPTASGGQSVQGEEEEDNEHGNLEEAVKSGSSSVNVNDPTVSDVSAQTNADQLPVQPQSDFVSLSNGRSKSPDKEPLISLDDPDEEKRKSEVTSSPPTEVPAELPLAAANQAMPTVTAVNSETGTIVISEKTGETTVTMETGENSSSLVNDTAEWESIPETKESPARMSAIAEKAKKLGRTPSFVEMLSRSNPLGLPEITDLVYNEDHYTGTHPLMTEYKSIPSNSAKLMDLLPVEMIKNRYRNVLPNTHSRVLLHDLGEEGSTYINANYIRGYGGREKAYIATQGPIYETISDFWRMVWEQDVRVIVMITGIIERGMHKCTKYWPAAEEPVHTLYGKVAVKNNYEEKTPTGVVSYLTLNTEDGGERQICHVWCTSWPDFGVPKETGSILTLRQMVDDYREQGGRDKPLLVHCSAGLGRSGTFIAIDMGIMQFEKEGKVDPLKYICEMRQDRGGIIQTPEQYLFVHNALADYMTTN